MRAMESGSHAPRDYIGVSKIESTFMRGADRLSLTEEPLELFYDFDTGSFQAPVPGEQLSHDGFLYFGALRYCLRSDLGPVVGFQVIDLASFEPEAVPDATFGPSFNVPELEIGRADVADIIYAAKRHFLGSD
jgi:hypothetical protein